MDRLTEKEKNLLVNVLLQKTQEICRLKDSLLTQDARNGVFAEAEEIRTILNKLTGEGKEENKGDYYIGLFDSRNGEEIPMLLSPYWYGISRDTMRGICFGIRGTCKRKNAEVRVFELHCKTRGEIVYTQH